MAKKGIEEMISEIEIFIDNCKYQPLSSGADVKRIEVKASK